MQSKHRSRPWLFITVAGLGLGLGAGCASEMPRSRPLELTQLDGAIIAGSMVTDESKVTFMSSSSDQRVAVLHLEVNGAALDFTYDSEGMLTEDGHHNVLHAADRTALVQLRDAINGEYPEVVQGSLQGRFLSRHADWLADAPLEYTVETRTVDFRDKISRRKVANSTHDDDANTTCLRPGVTYTAFYDAGNGGAQWSWARVANSGSCLGRCGAGCNIFDTDLMLDCFEHDTCVDHFGGSVLADSPNCGDEFNHAVAEYAVTLGAWCPF
jgi:hypothetical protein